MLPEENKAVPEQIDLVLKKDVKDFALVDAQTGQPVSKLNHQTKKFDQVGGRHKPEQTRTPVNG